MNAMRIKQLYLGLMILSGLSFFSCKEEPPAINYEQKHTNFDTTYVLSSVPVAQLKEILLEDLSGVKCVNCPTAAVKATEIVANAAGKTPPRVVNVVTNQPNTPSLDLLTSPITEGEHKSKYTNLRTKQGGDIALAVGIPNNLPNGYINRKPYNGNVLVDKDFWTDAVNQEMSATTPVNIDFLGDTATYITQDLTVHVGINVTFTELQDTSPVFLSIMLLEDSIVDAQESRDPNNGAIVYLDNYVHNHLLRDMFTASMGDQLNTVDPKTKKALTLVPGRFFQRAYSKKTNMIINPGKEHLHILAFVHKGSNKYVLQSKSIHLKYK
jgi:hypothetical protein